MKPSGITPAALLGCEEHVVVRLHVAVEREVLAAEAQAHHARACARDLVEACEGIGGFDHRDEFRMAERHTALQLELAHQLVEQLYMRSAVDFRQRESVHVRREGMFDIPDRHRERSIDPHHHVGTCAPHPRSRRLNERARAILLTRRDAVFEIELDHVGAAGMCLLHVLFDVDGHIHERAPDGEFQGHRGVPVRLVRRELATAPTEMTLHSAGAED